MGSHSRTRVSWLALTGETMGKRSKLISDYSTTDMDLCCFLAKDAPMRPASELVQVLGSLIEQGPSSLLSLLSLQESR